MSAPGTPVHLSPTRTATRKTVDVDALRRDLEAAMDGEVRFDAQARGAYSTDASNYRQIPIGVVVPASVDDAIAALGVCRHHGAPVTSRGGGTSLGGECTNVAVIVDWAQHCHHLVSVDADARTCIVEPGIVLDELNRQLAAHGLEFGPRPSTHSHCTIGGMIGNNSCGATAQRAGKVVDKVVRLEILLEDGTRSWVGPLEDEELAAACARTDRLGQLYRDLRDIRDRWGPAVRQRFPDIPRRVSGYNLDALLPEQSFDLAKLVVGSEGTLATILRAELRLMPTLRHTVLVVIGFDGIVEAGRAVPHVVSAQPTALEALDSKLVHFERSRSLNPEALDLLPDAGAWLIAQGGGQSEQEARKIGHAILDALDKNADDADVAWLDHGEHQAELWRVRESALGATARLPGHADAWPGWEDAAVHPDRLGDYLADYTALLESFGYGEASVYGHFGQGCVHCRLPFDLVSTDGIEAFRAFLEAAAELVSRYGGSLSGEHGDGQARGELLTTMFGVEIVGAFGSCKHAFDPRQLLNPGKLVSPRPLDADLRLGADYEHRAGPTWFRYPEDEGSFSRAALRCVGVGECRREEGGVMCPSYRATHREEHSTRGRARLLFEMLDGSRRDGPIADGWRSEAVRDALDLCLACKGCRSDCPVNVDMATYKAEFLAHHYHHRIRPRSHYSMGWLPAIGPIASSAPGLANGLTAVPVVAALAKRLGGIDPQRHLPQFPDATFQAWARRRAVPKPAPLGEVLLWPDTFTNRFHPGAARAAVGVLEDAGWNVSVPTKVLCCGLTWISTGQLAIARRVLRRSVHNLAPHLRRGGLVVGLEPSCTAVFRSDARELLERSEDIERLRHQTVTLAELLTERTPGWHAPEGDGAAVVQPHCHHHAIMGYGPDEHILRATFSDVTVLEGCCGLAGNFGFEAGHYDTSMACAEQALLPAARAAPDATVVADGFSCRTQVSQALPDRRPRHLAEVLADLRSRP